MFKEFWRDKVSLILVLLFVLALIGYFTKQLNTTPFLGFAILNMCYQMHNKHRFIENILKEYPNADVVLYPNKEWFSSSKGIIYLISDIVITMGFLGMLALVGYKFIF